MDEDEIPSMIEDIGIEKRGHIIKLKNAGRVVEHWNISNVPVQKVMNF